MPGRRCFWRSDSKAWGRCNKVAQSTAVDRHQLGLSDKLRLLRVDQGSKARLEISIMRAAIPSIKGVLWPSSDLPCGIAQMMAKAGDPATLKPSKKRCYRVLINIAGLSARPAMSQCKSVAGWEQTLCCYAPLHCQARRYNRYRLVATVWLDHARSHMRTRRSNFGAECLDVAG